MNQNVLTTFSIVAINQQSHEIKFNLTNKSFIRDEVFMNSSIEQKDYENCLFYVETDGNSRQYKSTIQFGQKVLFRHKISNKYLSHSEQFEQQQNDTTYKLKLSHHRHHFRIYPCFQYQTKISNKIRFNEEIHLVTDISGAKTGYVSSRSTNLEHIKKTIIGINSHGSGVAIKFSFHSYYQSEKQETNYTFGSIFWLQHVQSQTFMTSKIINQKKQIFFEPIDQDKDLQSINGLWLMQSDNMGVGGKLSFQQKFKLKNLSSQTYMSFTKSYKMVENRKIYGIVLEQTPSKQSQFSFRDLKDEQNLIKKGSYLIFLNWESKYFIGTRKKNTFEDSDLLKPIAYPQFTDEDLFKLVELNQNQQEAIRFILSIRYQIQFINITLRQEINHQQLKQGKQIFGNILLQLQKLKKYEKLFQKIQGEMRDYIFSFCQILKKYRSKLSRKGDNFTMIVEILNIIYSILVIICSQNLLNQIQSYRYASYYVEDIFLGVGAQNVLIQTFRNNQEILCKVPTVIPGLKDNIVKASINIIRKFAKDKNHDYWHKILKFLELLRILIINGSSLIDINQRLISEQFFSNDSFFEIFFGIKIINNRIKIEDGSMHYNQLERIKNTDLLLVIEEVFKLFSLLCSQRNYISKKYINNVLNPNNKNAVQVMIAYLSMPIRPQIIDNLYSLITNLYVDSAPRIERLKPLGVINFALEKPEGPGYQSMRQQTEIAQRLNQNLQDRADNAYKTRPLSISNLLSMTMKTSMQPSLNNEQLSLYKQQLLDKINQDVNSLQLLKSIKCLICLQSFSGKQILQINSLLCNKLKSSDLPKHIIIGIMQIFIQVITYSKQVQLKKLGAFLKYKYRQNQKINYQKQYQYLLPYTKRLQPGKKFSAQANNSVLKYNSETDMVNIMNPGQQIKNILFDLLTKMPQKKQLNQNADFINSKNSRTKSNNNNNKQIITTTTNEEYIEKIYECFMRFNFRQQQFLNLVMNSIVLTNQQVPIFQTLFDYYKKLKHLVAISEYWLCSDGGNQDNLKNFIKYMVEIVYYLHKDYHEPNIEYQNTNVRNKYTGILVKQGEIYVNRQLLLRNIGFHLIIFELIEANYYLLDSQDNKDRNPRFTIIQQVFSLCFQFLYGFIYNCQQTKQIIHYYSNILQKYQQKPQVGQTRVLKQLYKGKPEYIGEIKKHFIEEIIHKKILKNLRNKGHQGNQYDPLYLSYLETIVKVDNKIYKPNLEKLYRVIEKEIIFRKLMFAKQVGKNNLQLCINMFDIKINDNIQVPFIYHTKILCILSDMFQNLDLQSTIIGSKIRAMFDLEYLIRQLYTMDIYTHNGIQAQLRFLLKKQIMRIVNIFLQKNDSINVLLNSQGLVQLIKFYEKVFINRVPVDSCDFANQTLYIPYLKEYSGTIRYYQNNQRQYFLQEIKPFLQKILTIFIKSKKHLNNPVCQKIEYILENYRIQELKQNYQYRKKQGKINKVTLKWLNYVDNDDDNGPQQKFAKLAIVEMLRSKTIEDIVSEQKQKFFKQTITKKKNRFMQVLLQMMISQMQKKTIQSESEQVYKNIHQYLRTFNDLLKYIMLKQQQQAVIVFLLEKDILSDFINYTTKSQFDYVKVIAKQIYHEILKVLIFMMQNNQEQKSIKQFYKLFNQQTTLPLNRFWEHLNESIYTIKLSAQSQNFHEQVDQSLKHIYFVVEERKQNIYEQSLIFIQILCQYQPFTKFLRYQPFSFSIDFLEVMYHTLHYIIYQKDAKMLINISVTDAAQKLSKAILAMMLFGNQVNQNYLIDNKFPEVITEILKLQKIKRQEDRVGLIERQRIIEEVIEFYNKNGIDITEAIRKRIQMKDFDHTYILNRLKYNLLHMLIGCVAGNQLCMNKIKFQIPIQLLKINLIWVYEDYIEGKHQYKQKQVLKDLISWKNILDERTLNQLFLENGFYLYYLIQHNQQTSVGKNQDDDAGIQDKQKNKQKIVKKFFSTISDKDRKKQKDKKLENQPFAEEMKMYYNKYYQAVQFFQNKTLTIQVSFNGGLTKVYFPRIPLCDKMTSKMIQQFKEDAVRISQQQKLKSLMEFEEDSYDFLQGQQDFFKRFQKVPIIEKFFRILNQDLLRLFALIMCFIQTILFLLQDFAVPSFSFAEKFSAAFPDTALSIIIFVIGLMNLFLGFIMTFYLFFKKTPILFAVLSMRESRRDQSERLVIFHGPYAYIFKQLIPEFMTTFIYIACLIGSFLHPLFAGFILFDIMARLQLGRQILRSIKQTWFQLLTATVLLIVINYLYSLYVYIQFTQYYSPTCEYLFQCLLLLLDQSLKSDSGFLGSTPIDYGHNVFSLKFFSEMLYIIFAQKVIFEIFSGTIIDKFSQLREANDAIEEDQNSNCYVCGQQRFVIDFQLEGFEDHTQQNHNFINYVFYLFYLRRKDPQKYGIIDRYVYQCQKKSLKTWIPNETSIYKEEKQKHKKDMEEENADQKMQEYVGKQIKQIKNIRFKSEQIMGELKLNISKIPV